MEKVEIGRLGETAVCQWLEARGYTIVDRNYCVRGGEIDIIAKNETDLAFVEVKTRKPGSMVSGYDAVTVQKQQRIIRAAALWCAAHPLELQPRFDVAVVEMSGTEICSIDYVEQAFDASDSAYIF